MQANDSSRQRKRGTGAKREVSVSGSRDGVATLPEAWVRVLMGVSAIGLMRAHCCCSHLSSQHALEQLLSCFHSFVPGEPAHAGLLFIPTCLPTGHKA